MKPVYTRDISHIDISNISATTTLNGEFCRRLNDDELGLVRKLDIVYRYLSRDADLLPFIKLHEVTQLYGKTGRKRTNQVLLSLTIQGMYSYDEMLNINVGLSLKSSPRGTTKRNNKTCNP